MIGRFLIAWAALAGQADLVALIGTRFAPWKTGQGLAKPRMVYLVVSGTSVKTLTAPRSLRRSRVQIEAQADTYEGARIIAAKVIGDREAGDNRLDGYAGTLGGIIVQGCHLDDESELFDEPIHANDGGTYRVVMDFILWWKGA